MSGKITLKIVARQFQPKKYNLSEKDVQTIHEYSLGFAQNIIQVIFSFILVISCPTLT